MFLTKKEFIENKQKRYKNREKSRKNGQRTSKSHLVVVITIYVNGLNIENFQSEDRDWQNDFFFKYQYALSRKCTLN